MPSGERAAGRGRSMRLATDELTQRESLYSLPTLLDFTAGNGFMGAQEDWKNAVRAAVGWEYE